MDTLSEETIRRLVETLNKNSNPKSASTPATMEDRIMARFEVMERFLSNRMEQESALLVLVTTMLVFCGMYIFYKAICELMCRQLVSAQCPLRKLDGWENLIKMLPKFMATATTTEEPPQAAAPEAAPEPVPTA